jgi:hypothetical protein
MTTSEEDTRRNTTFERGVGFLNDIGDVDKLYDAVMADIAKSSFEGVGWKIDQKTVFRTDFIYIPCDAADEDTPLPKWIISKFDNSPGARHPDGDFLNSPVMSTKEKEVRNVQYAWDGDDQLAYIDGVASAVFLQ